VQVVKAKSELSEQFSLGSKSAVQHILMEQVYLAALKETDQSSEAVPFITSYTLSYQLIQKKRMRYSVQSRGELKDRFVMIPLSDLGGLSWKTMRLNEDEPGTTDDTRAAARQALPGFPPNTSM